MSDLTFFENVVILTGASRGIGRALAYLLADQGAWLSLAARDEASLEEVTQRCLRRGASVGAKALALPTDVSDQAQCQRLIERTVETYGRVDTLVNNAGITMWSRFDELQSLQPLERIMQVNYLGSVYCTYAALPYLKQRKGRIVAVASLAGKAGVPLRSGYAASKHAMLGFFDSLRIELAPYAVSVTMILPDFVATETRQRAFGPDGKPLGKSPVQESRVMTAEESAGMILEAMAGRRREQIQSLRGKLGQWIKLIAPGIVDRIARNAIQRGR
jgi:short-subunit dehydrogenase